MASVHRPAVNTATISHVLPRRALGAGEEVSIRRLAETVREVVGLPHLPIEHIAPRPGDVLRLFAQAHRAREALSHVNTIGLSEGLGDLAARLRSLGPSRLTQLNAGVVLRNWE